MDVVYRGLAIAFIPTSLLHYSCARGVIAEGISRDRRFPCQRASFLESSSMDASEVMSLAGVRPRGKIILQGKSPIVTANCPSYSEYLYIGLTRKTNLSSHHVNVSHATRCVAFCGFPWSLSRKRSPSLNGLCHRGIQCVPKRNCGHLMDNL